MSLNQEQFKIWHDQYRPRLLNSMTTMVRDREIAEDVTATALAIAWQDLNRFRGESSLYTWIYRIAVNEALRQKSQTKTVSIDALEIPLRELSESDSVSKMQERTAYPFKLKDALKAIPTVHRDVLIDHFVLGHKVTQIARRRSIPVGTVLSRIFTAKKRLRAAWESAT